MDTTERNSRIVLYGIVALLVAGLLVLAGCGTLAGAGDDIRNFARWSENRLERAFEDRE